ncbi:MAG: type II secretion system F family protein [Nanoarchaeota archaeon]|nr:type II secretion system F family protein [Nanoarchaeota archaeon]
MEKRLPLLPMSLDKAVSASRHLISLGDMLSSGFHSLAFELEQAGLDYDPREWISIALFAMIFYSGWLFGALFLVLFIAKINILMSFGVSLLVGFSIGITSFAYIVFYPKLYVARKVKEVEKNIPFALRHLLIEVRSGVPLFNALSSIARSNYGRLSLEMQRAVNEINTGKSEIAALEMLARQNPSLYFRRIMWQIVNSLKSGTDIGSTIKEIVNQIGMEQSIEIKEYGAQLNPIALMYMIFAVIFPTLGITFLLVISSFVGLSISLEWILLGILGFLLLFQFMIIGIIKSKRPIGV